MSEITMTQGQFPKKLIGTVKFNAGGTGNYTVGETVTVSSTFSGKVCKWNATTRELTVKAIFGSLTAGQTVTGGTSSAAFVVATINTVTVGGVAGYTGGFNIRETTHGITRTKSIGSRNIIEVLVAVSNLSVNRGDFAVVATLTLTGGSWSAGTTYDVSNGDTVTLTIVSSEPVQIPSGTTYQVSITGKTAVAFTYASSTTDFLTHTFSYVVQADDIGGTGFTVAAGNFTIPAGKVINEVAADGTVKAMTAPVAVGGTLAAKTGVTIQA